MSEQQYDFPTEEIELPSKGLIYPESNPLSSGKVVIRYPGAKQEDILSNSSYIMKGTVLDKYLQSIIVSPINYDDLIIGDKNALMVAARVLGQGASYTFIYAEKPYTIDLSTRDNKPLDETIFYKGMKNEFTFECPNTSNILTWKILTHKDEKAIQGDIEGLKKIAPEESADISTRLKYIITSVNGNRDAKFIREFVDKGHLISRDSKALREYIKKIQPDIDLTFFPDGRDKASPIPLGVSFFWSESE